jgi:hypothetical protein
MEIKTADTGNFIGSDHKPGLFTSRKPFFFESDLSLVDWLPMAKRRT